MKVQPYLNFNGRAEEAMAFYKQAIDAKGTFLMRCKEAPEGPPVDADKADKIMHAEFTVGESTIMCSDGYCTAVMIGGAETTACAPRGSKWLCPPALPDGSRSCILLT